MTTILKNTIGRAERINLPTLGTKAVPAKIDTGADSSSIWCSYVRLAKGELQCIFFGPKSKFYTGHKFTFQKKDIDVTRIASSFGHKQVRYKVKIPVVIKGRTIKASFTLTDRSTKLYPILIGRSALNRKFIVDVSRGSPLKEEDMRRKKLEDEMTKIKKGLKL